MAAGSGVRCAQGIARPLCPLRSRTLARPWPPASSNRNPRPLSLISTTSVLPMNRPTLDPSWEEAWSGALERFPSWEGSGVGWSMVALESRSSTPEGLVTGPFGSIRGRRAVGAFLNRQTHDHLGGVGVSHHVRRRFPHA